MQSQHASDSDALLGPAESAALVGVSVDTLKRWEKAGRIQSSRTPTGHRRFRKGEVLALLEITPKGAAS